MWSFYYTVLYSHVYPEDQNSENVSYKNNQHLICQSSLWLFLYLISIIILLCHTIFVVLWFFVVFTKNQSIRVLDIHHSYKLASKYIASLYLAFSTQRFYIVTKFSLRYWSQHCNNTIIIIILHFLKYIFTPQVAIHCNIFCSSSQYYYIYYMSYDVYYIYISILKWFLYFFVVIPLFAPIPFYCPFLWNSSAMTTNQHHTKAFFLQFLARIIFWLQLAFHLRGFVLTSLSDHILPWRQTLFLLILFIVHILTLLCCYYC